MKKTLLIALAIMACGTFATANAAKKDKKTKNTATTTEALKLTTKSDSLSYAAGMSRTEGLLPYLKQSFDVDEKDMADFIKGYEDILKANLSQEAKAYAAGQQIALMVDTRMLPYLQDEFKDSSDSINAKLFNAGFIAALKKDNTTFCDTLAKPYFNKAVKDNIDAMNKKNKEAGEKFLAENKTKEGVVTLPSGLQYKVLVAGTGDKPTTTDRVKVKYEGKTIDGRIFDSSYKRTPPESTFGVTQVIKGWTEALQLMPVGSKWELYIPYNLAYGEKGAGRDIKPYDALIFTVELVEIDNPQTEKKRKDDAINSMINSRLKQSKANDAKAKANDAKAKTNAAKAKTTKK